ncbi:MAG: exodeoxyribonuclease V subunit gamma [Spirochaetia bacterium]
MAYHLLKSPCMEDLILAHKDLFIPKNPLSQDTLIIVQNQQTTRWLAAELAKKNSLIMGFEAFLIEEGFRQLAMGFDCVKHATKYDEETSRVQAPFLFDDDLKLLIYHQLLQHKENPALQFVQQYLQKIAPNEQDTQCWNMAGEIGTWFAQYARSSSKLMRTWRENTALPNLGEKEPWQRFLWHQIFGGDTPAYNFLGDWLDRIELKKSQYQGRIRQVILVGSAFLNQIYLDFLQYLSADIEITHFLLQTISDNHPQLQWPFLINHTIMSQQLMRYFSEKNNTIHTAIPLTHSPHTALQSLQSVIYFGQEMIPRIPLDDSLKQITCSDPYREVEVLKDQILQCLDRDKTLQLNEIAVIAPNINKYGAHIQAVFERGGHSQYLPYNMIDLDESRDPAFTQASLGLLNLTIGNFSRKDIFVILDNPLIIERYNIQEEDRCVWLDFCAQTEILFHKNAQHRASLGLGNNNLNTFDKSFGEFLLSRILGHSVSPSTEKMSQTNESTKEKIGKFIAIVEQLYADFYPLAHLRLTIQKWLDKIEHLFLIHLQSPGQEQETLHIVFSHLRESTQKIANLEYSQQAISFGVIKEIISDVIKGQKRKIGRYLAHGIVCSSMIPLRALPFKIIAVLGLSHGEFPAMPSQKNIGYDLLETNFLKDQLIIWAQKNYLDRHAFLETIFSARQALWLFYQDRHSINGNKISASASICDLQALMHMTTIMDTHMVQWPKAYPKSPFSAKLYTPESGYHSYDKDWYALCASMQSQECPLAILPTDKDCEVRNYTASSINIKELYTFVKNPVGYFEQYVVQIDQRKSYHDVANHIDESFELSYREQGILYDKFLKYVLRQEESSWHSFLNTDRDIRLKTGNISNEMLSRRYYLLLEKKIGWMSEVLTSMGLPRLTQEVLLHRHGLGSHSFDAPLVYTGEKFCYIYGLLEKTFLDKETQMFYFFRIEKEDKAESSIFLRYEAYLYLLLCKCIAPDYEFHAYILFLETQKKVCMQLPEISEVQAKEKIAQLVEACRCAYERPPQIDTRVLDKKNMHIAEIANMDEIEMKLLREFYWLCEKK